MALAPQPLSTKPNKKLSEASRVRLDAAKKNKSGPDANNNSYPKPKLVLDGDFELIGRHPNKAAYILFGNNETYPAPELNISDKDLQKFFKKFNDQYWESVIKGNVT